MSPERIQVDSRGNKATRTACTRLAPSQRIAAAIADGTIVATLEKAATRSNDVLEGAAVDADLQHAPVKAGLKRIIVAEHQGSIFELFDHDRWRVEIFVANRSRIINPCCIGK